MTQEDSETMEDAIESVVQRVLYNEVSTFFPGIITAVKQSPVNPMTVIVDVNSAFLAVDPYTNTPKPRMIQNVPLLFGNRTNTFIQRPPTDELSLLGAGVGLLICNSYLANWKKTGGTVLPTDGRKFNYADAVAIPGLYSDLQSWATPPKANTAQMKVSPGTYMEIGSPEVDIPRLLSDILNILQTAVAPTGGGPLVYIPSTLPPLKTLAQLTVDLAKITNPDFTP